MTAVAGRPAVAARSVSWVPVAWSLAATVTVLAATMVLSLYVPARGYPGGAYPFKAKHEKGGDKAKK